jgi:hypothetical protein
MYKLYIEKNQVFNDWNISIDFSDIWDKYKSNNDLSEFVKNYKLKFNENKNNIIENKDIGVWNDLVNILNKLKDFTDFNIVYPKLNEVYNWADKNHIEIKIK